ncbi:hypothetical protein ACUW9Z_001043 [Aerococcus sp. 150760007-1]|uniref:Major capsid protein n=1 Tax=Aerococcus urinaeequi TaxID=51665 RepID=A0ABR5ZY80_9LACT|nr:hypothetical protein [Aerococcus urinaeequi]MBA5746689.1 hypothetical protein [Aerococcus urinaeequi]MBA5829516.1 hypothetical protein [Aerococcus urinaeequi]MBA5860377.1 hypothetical protein [Aerococcus urinaeequi]
MAVEPNLTTELGTALSIDFVEQFGQRFRTLQELLGVQRTLPMAAGTLIKTYTSSVTLDGTQVAPGDIIPLSQVTLEDGPSHELEWDKKRKAVTMEDIQKYGFDRAVTLTDNKLINEIQKGVRTKLLTQLSTGTATATGTGLQQVMAKNWATVTAKFDEDDVQVVSFMNPYDAGDYLGNANISTQSAFGMTYIEDFLNNRVVFMSAQIPEGTVYSTADGNLVAAYALMSGGQINQAFDFTTDSTGLIGVTHDINKQRLQAETVTAYGIELFAERLDGIVVGTIAPAV